MQTKKRKLAEISGDPLQGRQPLTKRRNNSQFDIINYFTRAIDAYRQPRTKRIKKEKSFLLSKKRCLVVRREIPESLQAMVIFLRFGSLQDDSVKWHSATEVFRKTGVRLSTQWKIIRRWRERGFVIVRHKRKGRQERLSKEQIDWLVDINTLQSMAHLNLRERSHIVKEKFGLEKFHLETLRLYYKRYGVKFKRPDYKFWKSQAENRELRIR